MNSRYKLEAHSASRSRSPSDAMSTIEQLQHLSSGETSIHRHCQRPLRPNTQFNVSLGTDTQSQDAASRRVLRAGYASMLNDEFTFRGLSAPDRQHPLIVWNSNALPQTCMAKDMHRARRSGIGV